MMDWPILSLVTFLPLVGVAALLLIGVAAIVSWFLYTGVG